MVKKKLIGERLKKLRKEKSMTLKELAEITGISAGYISKIERDNVNPSAGNIQKLSYALGITANELMATRPEEEERPNGHGKGSYVVRKGEYAPIYLISNILSFESILEEFPQFKVNVMSLVGILQEQFASVHAYDEFGIVAKGVLGLTLNDEVKYELAEGDCILIRANTKHSSTKLSDGECISYWIEISNN